MVGMSPMLPPELEREIFEIAVHNNYRRGYVNLMLVARRVHGWIASIIYCVAIQLIPPRSNNPSAPSLQYFGPFVKHLITGGAYLEQDFLTILEGCHNLVDLALWTHVPTQQFLPIFGILSLNRLSTNLAGLSFEDLTSPAFTRITHLDITGLDHEPLIGWSQWRALTRLTCLTHIAINTGNSIDNSDEVVRSLLRDCRLLQILLIIENLDSRWNLMNVPLSDPRLVLMKIPHYVVWDWVEGARGNEDTMWQCAEEISRAKQNGFLKGVDPRMWFTRYGYRKELSQHCGYPKS